MTRVFNDVVCIDHCFQDNMSIFHMMDLKTNYSAGAVVDSLTLLDSAVAFDSHWITDFLPPNAVKCHQWFKKDAFKDFLKSMDISFQPVPPRRHSKMPLKENIV